MVKKLLTTLMLTAVLAVPVLADNFPGYYPDRFQRTGRLDAVQLDRQRIIINDVPYQLSGNVIVHSLSSYSVPAERLQAGAMIGFKQTGSRLVTEIWLLPSDYTPRRRR